MPAAPSLGVGLVTPRRGRSLRKRVQRSLCLGATSVLLASAVSCGVPNPRSAVEPSPTSPGPTADPFGVPYLRPSLPGGRQWVADWRTARTFDGVDPLDPWFDADHGSASYTVRSNELLISGRTPRMYIHDPGFRHQWRDVEITMYFKRVADADVPYAGMTAVARTNHGVTGDETQDLCDTRGYGARVRYDGSVDIEKETRHPHNEAAASRKVWPSGMPYNQWFGFKFIVYDLSETSVKLELWVDQGGGRWNRVTEMVDDGQRFGDKSCAKGVDPKMALTSSPRRPGSESGKPNVSVYFRSDGVSDNGLVYKWGSVREIT